MRLAKIKYKNSTAFTLVEIMVAVFITSLVSITVISLYTSGLKTFFQITETSKQADEFIVLFTTMEKDLSRGGFTHPIRSDLSFCGTGISPANAVKIAEIVDVPSLGGDEDGTVTSISSCFDRPTSIAGDDDDIERFKVTYAKGINAMSNTIFKKIVGADECDKPIALDHPELSNNAKAIIHDWLPVSSNVEIFIPEQSGRDNDIFDIKITLQSQRNPELRLDFAKRIFAKNKSLAVNAQSCSDSLLGLGDCRNAIKPFLNYKISSNTTVWDPKINNIPGGKIFFESGYNAAEDSLKYLLSDAPDAPTVTPIAMDPKGTLEIGKGTGEDYQSLINSIKYVYTAQEGVAPSKIISLILEADDCKAANYDAHDSNIYCYIKEKDNITWTKAKADAEEIGYYNYAGTLVSINTDNEFNFIKEELLNPSDNNDQIWIGGQNTKDGWQWISYGSSTEGPIVDAPEKIAPHEGEGKDYLYYNNVADNVKFTAAVQEEAIKNYITEFHYDIRPGNQCGGSKKAYCVAPYSTRTIMIADLNLCHRS